MRYKIKFAYKESVEEAYDCAKNSEGSDKHG